VTTCLTCRNFRPHHPGAERGDCAWIVAAARSVHEQTGVWVMRRSVGVDDGGKCRQWKEVTDDKA
jgi:hypothetical protein